MQKGQKTPSFIREKIGVATVGKHNRKHTEDEKIRISLNNAKFWKGKKLSEETKRKISLSKKGKPGVNKGKHWVLSDESKKNIGLGKKLMSKEKKEQWLYKKSIAQKGEKGSNWRGGISFEIYPENWTDDLKESIRKRDGYVCQECGLHQDEYTKYNKKFHIHHIDYDKHNLNPENLITLCNSCHCKTNFNREYWIKYFNNNKKTYE